MGVKSYYLLFTDDGTYCGPAAFHYLRSKCERAYRSGNLEQDPSALILSAGGWRKKIEPLVKLMLERGLRPGRLRKLKTSNPLKDPTLRDLKERVQPPRPKTPRLTLRRRIPNGR